MGYSYCIRIACGTKPSTQDIDKMEREYSKLLEDNSGWFPTFGETETSSSGGYGTGPNEDFSQERIRFTFLFPQYTFFIYFFYWDMMMLEVFSIQDTDILKVKVTDLEDGISIPGGKVSLSFDGYINVPNEILSKGM